MYLQYIYGVFECTYNMFVVYFNVPIIYFNALIVCFNVFQCVWMYFNVFECIYWHCNWISPSLSHCNVFAIHTHLHIFFSLYTMIPFPTCYTTTFLFFHSRWSILTFIQSILIFHVYTSPHIPHSTFYVVTGCVEHSGAQVIYSIMYAIYNILCFKLLSNRICKLLLLLL
jgi:hypothetical protein